MKLEIRNAPLDELGEGRVLRGLALPFGKIARLRAGREMFEPGSVTTSGEALLNAYHDQRRPLAREPQTLTFVSTDEGLRMEADLPETREADDALALVRAGVIKGLSIEFHAIREVMRAGVRVVQRAQVVGVALALNPVYGDTNLEARDEGSERENALPLWVLS